MINCNGRTLFFESAVYTVRFYADQHWPVTSKSNPPVFFLTQRSFLWAWSGVFTKILLLKTYQMRSLLIDWLLGNNYLRKRFCYFILCLDRWYACFFINCFQCNLKFLNVYLHFCQVFFLRESSQERIPTQVLSHVIRFTDICIYFLCFKLIIFSKTSVKHESKWKQKVL